MDAVRREQGKRKEKPNSCSTSTVFSLDKKNI